MAQKDPHKALIILGVCIRGEFLFERSSSSHLGPNNGPVTGVHFPDPSPPSSDSRDPPPPLHRPIFHRLCWGVALDALGMC